MLSIITNGMYITGNVYSTKSVEVLIAGVIGYDSIRKHLAECERQKEKEILSVKSRCVHRYKEVEGTILVGEHYER